MADVSGRTTRRAGGAALLAAFAVVFGVFLFKDKLTAPPPVEASAPFDTARAFARLARILGDQRPHPVDSEANDAVRERLLGEIRALGYAPEVRDDFSCWTSMRWRSSACARVRNVIFRAGPEGGNAILVASHYDSVPAGPGASDDGAGVAAALEIAAQLKGRALQRPVIFLVTDGEEAGLLGAASFVRKDPYAKDVAAVVNMEARGVEGQAIMFQSGAPNGRELLAFAAKASRPVANSMATAIYKAMPNDTDMTEFLKLGPDALNFAYAGRVAFYHTPHDNLANLDKRSLGHLGGSALGAVEGLLEVKAGAADRDLAFVDILGHRLIILPYAVCIGLFVAGIALGAFLYVRVGGGGFLRASLVPPAAAILGGALAFGAFFLIGRLRPEPVFWGAHPAAAQATLYLSAMVGAAAAIVGLGATANRARLAASAWLWFLALAAVGFHFAPGSAGLTAPLAGAFAAAAFIALVAPPALPVVMGLAAAAAFLIWAPMLAFGESALGLGAGWAFAPVATLLVCLVAPAVLSDFGRPGWRVPAGLFGALVVAFAAALIVPAYSPKAPLPLNIVHYRDAASGAAWWALPDAPKPPAKLVAAAPFEKRTLPGFDGALYAAPAPALDPIFSFAMTAAAPADQNRRRIAVKIESDLADSTTIIIPEAAGLVALDFGGQTVQPEGAGDWSLRCRGRACRTFAFEATVGAKPATWNAYGSRFGLGADAAGLLAARTASETPLQSGDTRREWRAAEF